jgi:hypothetical protein
LISHGIADTITVDDEVGRLSALVVVLEAMNGFADKLLHLVFDNFLALGLDYVLRVILRHLFVSGSSKSDYRLSTSVTDIDTNEHSLNTIHDLRELHSK